MTIEPISKAELERATADALRIIRSNVPLYTDREQNHSSVHGVYPTCRNTQWTCGFWPGELWISWELTRDPVFKACAETHVRSFLHRAEHRIEVETHDMGFLYTPSCVSAWKLTENDDARKAALLAADLLLERWQPKGRFLQAWGSMGAKGTYRYIIDCLLNLPLLYWATEETGNETYRQIALAHTKTCLTYSFRPDWSTYHTYFLDPETGKGLYGETCQGYKADSSWARGQAWAVYGLALAYRQTQDESLLTVFDGAADYFLSRLPDDLIPYWDLIFQEGDEPRDSSSASIVACGLLEMARINEKRKETCTLMAKKLIGQVYRTCHVSPGGQANGLVLHGTYSKRSPYNTCTEEGVDECVSWGDYFYLEALARLTKADWHAYW